MSFGKSPIRLLAVASAIVPLAAVGLFAPSAGAAINSCAATGGSFAGGAGTTADPYLVSNQAQLEAIRTSTYVACAFRQTADIALTGDWTPIGAGPIIENFTGEYDGNGKTISGLDVSGDNLAYEGLFGYAKGPAHISDLFVTGSVTSNVGGFGLGVVGMADSGTVIRNVHADVDVTATAGSRLGGLVGWGPEATIEESSAVGDVVGSASVGGLVGQLYGRTFGGPPQKATITDSYSTGNVTGSSTGQGIGGLVGSLDGNDNRVIRSYATGLVTGGTSGSGTSGGLIGPQSGGGPYTGLTVTGSFWDTETTGKSTSANGLGTGKTTAEMKSFSTFNTALWDITDGWSDSTVWGICDGLTYPFLSTQYSSSPCEFDLSVTKSGTGSGTVTSSPSGIDCGSDCAETYDRDIQVTLTASAASGSSFSGWSGAGCSGNGTCEVTMSEARSVEAAFAADPPTPDPPTPSGEPKLRVSMGGADRVRAGKAFKLGVQVRNTGTGPAQDVDTCLALPKALLLVKAKGAKVSGKSICWTRSSLGENKTTSYKATVRSSSTSKGSLVARATVSASNASGGSVSSGGSEEIRIVKPRPKPQPKPPTG